MIHQHEIEHENALLRSALNLHKTLGTNFVYPAEKLEVTERFEVEEGIFIHHSKMCDLY